MLHHEIEPVFNGESRVLLLGSFPSPKSREQGFFYGHPQNRMWKVLAALFGEEVPESPGKRREFLLRNRIAMWDVLAECEIDGASDSSIRSAAPNDLSAILEKTDIRAVFTTGAKAAEYYEKFNAGKYDVPQYRLPSTSPANAAMSPEALKAAYTPVLLFTLQDAEYRKFQCRLMPTVPEEQVIGVRTPEMRKLAARLSKDAGFTDAFLSVVPHAFYEENNLHGMLLERMKEYDRCIAGLDRFLPYVDNWATCDLISPKVFRKNKEKLAEKCGEWLQSSLVYVKRFGTEMLMSHFLDEDFDTVYLDMAARTCPEDEDDYYSIMMTAWYFATALAKQWESTLPYLQDRRLHRAVHNKTIRKACESYRITAEQKEYLKTLLC